MTIADVLNQAKALSIEERKELVKQLVDTLTVLPEPAVNKTKEHWGQALNRLLDETGPIEMRYPDIEDPVAWVKQLREDQQRRRLGL